MSRAGTGACSHILYGIPFLRVGMGAVGGHGHLGWSGGGAWALGVSGGGAWALGGMGAGKDMGVG